MMHGPINLKLWDILGKCYIEFHTTSEEYGAMHLSMLCKRMTHMETLNVFHLLIHLTHKGQTDFIFLCGIALPPVEPLFQIISNMY